MDTKLAASNRLASDLDRALRIINDRPETCEHCTKPLDDTCVGDRFCSTSCEGRHAAQQSNPSSPYDED